MCNIFYSVKPLQQPSLAIQDDILELLNVHAYIFKNRTERSIQQQQQQKQQPQLQTTGLTWREKAKECSFYYT